MESEQSQVSIQQLKDKLKRNWTKLSEEEISCYEGKREVFLYIVQSKYKVSKEQAEDALRYMERQCFKAA
jgi:hypothetical protein